MQEEIICTQFCVFLLLFLNTQKRWRLLNTIVSLCKLLLHYVKQMFIKGQKHKQNESRKTDKEFKMSILLLVVAILVEQRQAVALESWGHWGEAVLWKKGPGFEVYWTPKGGNK